MAARLRWSGALVSRPPAGCGADVLDARELSGELYGELCPTDEGRSGQVGGYSPMG